MSLAIRIIPCLDVDNGRVVKGVNFINLIDAGDPVELAMRYQQEGADEITFLDITASSQERDTTISILEKTAETVFIPLTVGGGIRSVSDVDRLLRAGADKVSINTAAIENPELINQISNRFGNQVLVISIDARGDASSKNFMITTHGGRKDTGIDMQEWISQVEKRGAGEILLNSIGADGSKGGYDTKMIELARQYTSLPIIASGGAGSLGDFPKAVDAGANALLAASIFHFGEFRINQVKQHLADLKYPVRI
jgi:cyclase